MIIYVIFVDGLLHGVLLIVTPFSPLLISFLAIAFFLQNIFFSNSLDSFVFIVHVH